MERHWKIEFHDGESLPGNADYKIIHRDGHLVEGRIAQPLGSGGAGVVYRALYKGMERAIKVLDPREDITTAEDVFERTFDAEVALLAKVTHTHLAKITDFGSIDVDDRTFKYFAMDYVDGELLADVWLRPDCTSKQFLDLLDDVLSALEYLHRKKSCTRT